jgi:hypothetical protein
VTGVFAMPYSGLCPNMGRLGISQKRVRPRNFRPPLQANVHHDARSRTPGISRFREVGARWTSYRILTAATICLQSRDGPYFTASTESCRLKSGENSPWEHRLERAIVELNDEGEHQVEQVAVLSREVEANNVTDGSGGFGLFTPLG